MKPIVRIGLAGDHDASVPAHRAIPVALRFAADELRLTVLPEGVPTESIEDASRVAVFDGLHWGISSLEELSGGVVPEPAHRGAAANDADDRGERWSEVGPAWKEEPRAST